MRENYNMGYRRTIHNIPIKGEFFDRIKEILKFYSLNISRIFQVRKGRFIYMVELEDGSYVRLDIYNDKEKVPRNLFMYQHLLYQAGVNVSKIIGLPEVGARVWKISEWIEGVRAEEVWNRKEFFEKIGEQIARINCVKDPKSGEYLSLTDLSGLNAIWTKNKTVYIIDLSILHDFNVDYRVVKTLILSLRTRNRIDCFLDGYKKIRDIKGILTILYEQEWKWKGVELVKDPSKDINL